MNRHPRITTAVWVLNSLGFLTYLAWLATSHERILHAREGVVFLLPCVAFLFVFIYLRAAHRTALEAEQDLKEDAWNAAHKP